MIKTFIFSHPDMLAMAYATRPITPIPTRHRDTVPVITHKMCPINRHFFPNQMPNIVIGDMDEIIGCQGGANVIYFSTYKNMEEKKMEEMIIFVLADTPNVNKLFVVDLYDPMATMERVTAEGEVATANVDAHFWKTLPVLASGRKTVRILVDHHTLQNRFYFTNGTTSVRFLSAMPIFAQIVGSSSVAFPDDGAYKRFKSFFKGCPHIVCGKQRVGDQRIVTIIDGAHSAKDTTVYIVDDLVRSGGTLLECAKTLREAGATKIVMMVTHAEFPLDSWRKFVDREDKLVDEFYVSDTIPRVTNQLKDKEPFKVVSMADQIRDILFD